MCGIFGIYGHDEAANMTYLGLHALQHRGQESAGIVTTDGARYRRHVAMGLVSDIFDHAAIAGLPGRAAIGQVRYSTAGGSELRNAQPFQFDYAQGGFAVAHNSHLTNAAEIRQRLEAQGSIFQTTSDTEVIVHLFAQARDADPVDRLATALRQVEGAYSLLVMTDGKLIAARDPWGFRPLVLGRLRDAYVVSSETCAFDLIEAEFIREIEPGEMVVAEGKALRSYRPFDAQPRRVCVFEHVYFARPDSLLNGRAVYRDRQQMGRELAREHPQEADVVIPVPDSGVPAAMGYASESGTTFELGLIRSHYVGRTFIEPQDSIRHFGVRLKLSPVRAVVDGKRVVVIDDSLVRGTTSRKIVTMLRGAGAREVHLRISAPPTTHSCFYGIDTPTREELIASSHSTEEIAAYIGCDSLAYLSHDGMMRAVHAADGATTSGQRSDRGRPADGTGYCSACFTGNYPVAIGGGKRPMGGELVKLRGLPRSGDPAPAAPAPREVPPSTTTGKP